MTNNTQATQVTTHGQGDPFTPTFARMYAAEGIYGQYLAQSREAAQMADILLPGGLANADVLDIGCGYGTTPFAIAERMPKSLLATDGSAAMVSLMLDILVSDTSIGDILRAYSALSFRFSATENYLKLFREGYRRSAFYRAGRRIRMQHLSALDLDPERIGTFDAVIGNNMFHWVVNKCKEEISRIRDNEMSINCDVMIDPDVETRSATIQALSVVRKVLRKDGIFVITEPKEVTLCDTQPDFEQLLQANTLSTHPVFQKTHEVVAKIAKQDYGLPWALPQQANLFKLSEIETLARAAGLRLVRSLVRDDTNLIDPIDWCTVRLLIWLGKLELSENEKVALSHRVTGELKNLITPAERSIPIISQLFFFAFRPID